jgi:hypothetical protein
MANLSAGSVTYTMKNLRRLGNSKVSNRVQLAFGDGVLTYPAGGVPLTKAKMGCPNTVESLVVYDQGTSGYKFQYDTANEKLVMIHSGSHTHNLLLKNAAVADGATARVNAGANLLGANTGSDITVTGGGANGGVVATTIGGGAEPSAVAVAAQTIIVEVIGW